MQRKGRDIDLPLFSSCSVESTETGIQPNTKVKLTGLLPGHVSSSLIL